MAQMKPFRVVGDVSGLPDHAFGSKSLIFWGTSGFMMVEGMGFVLAAGAYLYLRGQAPHWPPLGTRPPDLLWGTLFTLWLLVSGIPNYFADKAARRYDAHGARLWTLVTFAMAMAALALRGFEFAHLNCRWDLNAYGSVTWALMFLHTTHVATDAADTGVLGAFLRGEVDGERFSDVSDNAGYWYFVMLTWLPIYALVYWAPRLL